MISTPELRHDAALFAVAQGWAVLPVTGGRKSAVGNKKLRLKTGQGGVHAATKEKAVVEKWFTRWPKSNYGIACGNKSGVFVLDIDDQELADRELPWNTVDLTEKTLSVKTPHGWHIYYRLPADVSEMRSYSRKTTHGLEVKADGTYVLGPFCLTKDDAGNWAEYTPWNELEPAEAPLEVWEWVMENAPAKRARNDRGDAEAEGRELDPRTNCFDDFNLNADLGLYLERKGWTLVKESTGPEDPEHWCRPDKEQGVSATFGWAKVGEERIPLFHVFTSSVAELEPDRSYTPAGVFIQLEAVGDSIQAQRKLREMGYGTPFTDLAMVYRYNYPRLIPPDQPSGPIPAAEIEIFRSVVEQARAELEPIDTMKKRWIKENPDGIQPNP